MIKLNLTATNRQQEKVLKYLQENVSETLADKINNGTPFEKDEHPLLNKKTLADFMRYAGKESRQFAEKGEQETCVDDDTEVKDTKTDVLTAETDTDNEEFTEEEKADALRQLDEETQTQQVIDKQQGNPTYQKYTIYQAEHPTAIVAYRLGDFYEVLGDNAVLLGNELDLTITSRDVGLQNRIPMVGFPYHAAENYFAKIVKKHDLYIIENERDTQFISSLLCLDNQLINQDTGEIVDTLPIQNNTKTVKPAMPERNEIIDYLTELFDNEMEIKL